MVIRFPITKNQIWQDCNLSWQRSQEGPWPISQTLISSFVQGGTGWALRNDLQQIWALNIWQEEIDATGVKTWELLTMHSGKHSRYKPQKGGSQEQWMLKPQSWMLVAEIERFYQWLEMTGQQDSTEALIMAAQDQIHRCSNLPQPTRFKLQTVKKCLRNSMHSPSLHCLLLTSSCYPLDWDAPNVWDSVQEHQCSKLIKSPKILMGNHRKQSCPVGLQCFLWSCGKFQTDG